MAKAAWPDVVGIDQPNPAAAFADAAAIVVVLLAGRSFLLLEPAVV